MKSLAAVLFAFLPFAHGQDLSHLTAHDSKIEFQINNVTVVIEAGNLVTSSGQAVAFPGGGNEHGGALVVGDKLRDAGAQDGFKKLDEMFKAKAATGGFAPGTAQIVPSGGGTYEYLINLVTQDYDRTETNRNDRRLQGLSGDDLADAAQTLRHIPEIRLISESVRNLLFACTEKNISDVSIPFFGTGSFHGMHPLISLVAMLSGVERFSTTLKPIRIRMVTFGQPSPSWNQFFQDSVVPLIQAKYHEEARFDSFLNAISREPFRYTTGFIKTYMNPKPRGETCDGKI